MPDNWQSVELKHLRALRAVAETGTFWAAAASLSSSLSTVSDHLASLEALVGQRLVERSRGRRTVSLTEAGRLLLGHAEVIESRLRAASADFRAYAGGRSGKLRVGIYQSVANKVLPDLLRRFRSRWPDVDVEVREAEHDGELVVAVERGEVDVSFAIEPIGAGPFEVRELMHDPLVLVVPARAAVGRTVELSSLDGQAMVAFQHGPHQDAAEEFVRGQGVRPRFVFRTNDNGTLQAMVAAGLGWALMPLLTVDEHDTSVRLVQLDPVVPPRVPVMMWHRERYRPPSADQFVETAVAVARDIERSSAPFVAAGGGSVRAISGRPARAEGRPARDRRRRRSASRPA
jgi:molybdate transport repressor ModE-like protein